MEQSEQGVDGADGSHHVDVQDTLHAVWIGLRERADAEDPGERHQSVDPAVLRLDPLGQHGERLRIGDIRGDGGDPGASRGRREVHGHDSPTPARVQRDGRGPESTSRTGDDDDGAVPRGLRVHTLTVPTSQCLVSASRN